MSRILTIFRKSLLVLFIVLVETISRAEPLDWELFSTPFSANGTLNGSDIVFANNQFMVASQDGIFTSPDGAAWTQRSTNWADFIAGGGGKYVAIRASKAIDSTHFTIPAALASSDGINWSQPIAMTNSSPCYAGSVCYGNGLFLTAGSGGRFQEGSILVSADGTNWTQTLFGLLQQGFGATAFGNGVFAVSSFGRDVASSDGTNWTAKSVPGLTQITPHDNGLVFGNNEFVEVRPFFRDGFYRSSDGINWSYTNSPNFTTMCYGDNRWVTLLGSTIGVSTNLNDWTFDNRFSVAGTLVAHGNGRFVILSSNGQSLVAVTHAPPKLSLSQTASNYLALTISGEVGKTNSIETSSNLVDWAWAATYSQSNYDTSVQVTNPLWPNAFFRTVTK